MRAKAVSKEKSKARSAKRKLLVKMGQLSISRRPSDKQLDELWGRCIRERARKTSHYCRMCWVRVGTTAYHIVPKQLGYWIRWDLSNGLLSCGPCNGGEMMNRTKYRMRHVKMFGEAFVSGLEQKAVAGQGFPVDRWAVHLTLTQELKRLQGKTRGDDGRQTAPDKTDDGRVGEPDRHTDVGVPGGSKANDTTERGPGES